MTTNEQALLTRLGIILFLILVGLYLSGCTYTGKNDPYIQFFNHYEIPKTPRQIYFSNESIESRYVGKYCDYRA